MRSRSYPWPREDTGPDPLGNLRDMRGDRQTRDELDILILGPVPPPFGGVSVHLSRLVPFLIDAGFSVGVLNHFSSTEMPFVVGTLKRNPLNYFRLPRKFRARIVHYHHLRWLYLLAVALGKGSSNARYMLTRFDTVIVVDPKIASIMQRHLDDRRVELIPAFLESGHGEAERYDASVESFLSSGRVLVLAAFGVKFLRDGREIYGLDTAVEAFVNLAGEREDLRLALFLARQPLRPKARRHLARLERRMDRAGVRERVLIAFGLPLAPALRSNAVFLRPTRAEGDALSIREALQAGVPVVASDMIRRPDGVVLFPAGDVAELCVAVNSVLDDSTHRSRQGVGSNTHDTAGDSFSEKLTRLYRRELALSPRVRR